jgi:tetratricopeptide (TPR) repeat protein
MQTLVRLSANVVTIRTYSNPAEAAMAKSLLDSRDIFCRLADENVHLYGGGPLAMPIRLVVAEDQAQEAMRVLETKGPELPVDFDPGTPIEKQSRKEEANEKILPELGRLHNGIQWLVGIGITVLAILLYLVFGTPRDTDTWSRVEQAIHRRDYGRALNLVKQITSEDPQNYYSHEYLGYIYSQMGKLDQAELEYSRAYELAAKDLKARLEAVRKRRARQSQVQPTSTPTSILPP